MPAPTVQTYSAAALVAAHTAFRDLVDAGTAGGSIKIRDAADVLLATIPLTDPCGTVNAGTGQLTITPSGRDESADATGTAAYAEVCDSNGVVYVSLPTQQGTAPASNVLVLNTLSIVAGGPVEILSVVVG